jgi:hypothetical protein
LSRFSPACTLTYRYHLYCTNIFTWQADSGPFPKDKAHALERLYRFCLQSQALEPTITAYGLASRLCASFQAYVVEMGLRIVEDRKAEVSMIMHARLLISEIAAYEQAVVPTLRRLEV